jgi:endonuclease I/beta-lactamase superfamily II metal-dependent hydrolase
LIAIFRPIDKFAAVFMDSNGHLIDVQYISSGGNAQDILNGLPSKPGYVISSNKWDKSLNNIQKNTIFILQYTLATSASFSLSVINGSGNGVYNYNEYATVIANAPTEGLYFNYWKIDHQIVSFDTNYQFSIYENTTIEAVYSSIPMIAFPYISIGNNLILRENYKTYVGHFDYPNNFELVEFGIITSESSDLIIDLNSSLITRYQISKYNALTNEFVVSVPDTTNSLRAYLVVMDQNGNLFTSYNEFLVETPSYVYATDLFISEYIEGSSNNKAIEIFNGTGASINLSQYKLQQYNNGSTSPTYSLVLPNVSLSHGKTFVVYHSSSAATLIDEAIKAEHYLATAVNFITFNGNDAIALVKSTDQIIDLIGVIGSNSDFAANMTLTRKSSIENGVNPYSASEWNTYATDTFTYLGSHTMTNMGPDGGNASDKEVASIQAYIPNLTYEINASIDLTNAYLRIFYSDGSAKTEAITPSMISGFSSMSAGIYNLSVTHQSKTDVIKYLIEGVPLENTSLMIFEIYGGGGNSGAIYTHDYIVLYNGTNQNIDLSCYSIQYASATSSTYAVTSLSGIIYANTYYVIRLASGGSTGASLPISPNIIGSTNLSATTGKVALVSNSVAVSGILDADVIDFVGYGSTANEYETNYTTNLSNTTSAKRNSTTDNNNNATDFTVATAHLGYVQTSLYLTSIGVKNMQVYYEQNDVFILGSSKVILYYNNGSTEEVALETSMVANFTTASLGSFDLTITYLGKTTTFTYQVIDYSALESVFVHYIDVGYLGGGPGEAMLIQVGGIDILIDSGEDSSASETALINFLNAYITDGIIEYIIATHQDADHIGGFDAVFNAFIVQNAILYSTPSSIATTLRTTFEANLVTEGAMVYYIYDIVTSTSSSIEIASGVSLMFYNTDFLETADANQSAIVFTLEAFNTRVLFNADAEGSVEAVYASMVGDVDVFKMAHHGAAAGTTSYLLNTITPEVAIVNNGNFLGNQFNHPTYEAINRIYTYSILVPVYSVTGGNGSSSDRMVERNGTITVLISPSSYVITSEYFHTNPLEVSNTAYWKNESNIYRSNGYYYALATGVQEGSLLKSILSDIIDGHQVYSYSAIIEILKITDRDPNNTNNVLLFYTNRSQDANTFVGSTNNQDYWNREHIWAQSHGIDESGPGYSDLHHIRVTDVSVNAARGDLDFGYVSIHDATTLVNDTYGTVLSYNYKTSSYFEPRDEIKGDIARMMFYMATRYEGNNGEYDLELVDGITSSTSNYFGDLATLLLWHYLDPVDDFERNRNNIIYSYQGNRNPFIDRPELVEIIFGTRGD